MRFSEFNSVTENLAYPTFKAIFKYKYHGSILAIQGICEKETSRFREVNIEEIKKNILKLDKKSLPAFKHSH